MGWKGNREWEWDQNDEVGLTRFVMFSKDSKAVADFINRGIAESELPPSGYDFNINNPQRDKLVEAIYNALSRQGLNYDRPNDNESSQKIQLIPTPEKLFHDKKGTCLDLSILFCAICWHYDLLPILILTERDSERHAFVAVSRTHRRRDWCQTTRQGQAIFNCKGLTNNSEDLFELEDYLAVECTGFARSTTLSDDKFKRNSDGLLTFQQATELGRQKLDNAANNKTLKLKVAIDIALGTKTIGGMRYAISTFKAKVKAGLIPSSRLKNQALTSTWGWNYSSEILLLHHEPVVIMNLPMNQISSVSKKVTVVTKTINFYRRFSKRNSQPIAKVSQ